MDNVVFAIDPGPTQSAWMLFKWDLGRPILHMGIDENQDVLASAMHGYRGMQCAIEKVVPYYGNAKNPRIIGQSTIDTAMWIGRFMQAWGSEMTTLMPYREISMHLCGCAGATDPALHQALIDRFGGTMRAAKGLKKTPGPLYGVKTHLWNALGVAVTYADLYGRQKDGID